MTTSEIFDRAARRQRRDRAAPGFADHDFLRAIMIDGLIERLGAIRRSFTATLDIGSFAGEIPAPSGARIVRIDPGFAFARRGGAIQADEDRMPFADGSFDLAIAAGTLDQIGDLPGALTQVRRLLVPDGLFLGAFPGGSSLATLRAVLREAEPNRSVQRVHPSIDVRSAGDLLVRAGFALPVADVETVTVRYASLGRLFADLRGSGATNLLVERHPLSRAVLGRAADAFAARADSDGRVSERFDVIFVTAWSPSPSQPVPARRGSAGASLAAALPPRSRPGAVS